MSLPQEHIDDAHKLQGDGKVYLYEIQTTEGTLFLKANDTVTWQGTLWAGTAIQLDAVSQNSDGQKSRPTLTMANPGGVYSAMAHRLAFDNCKVIERAVLRTHIDSDVNIFQQRQWAGRLITGLNRISLTMQLRESLDGPRFLLPARMYTPPNFPSVTV